MNRTRSSGGAELRNVGWCVLYVLLPCWGLQATACSGGGSAAQDGPVTDGGGGATTDSSTPPSDYHKAVLGPGVTPADVERFDTASPAAGCSPANIDYPLDRAVMPRNVYPPKIMWTYSAEEGDIYRVRLKRSNAMLDGYFVADASAWRPAGGDFSPLANLNVGQDIVLTVTVLTGGGLCEGAGTTFKTVDAYIAGSVYYWSPPNAKIFRVDVDKGLLVDFMPNAGGCVACHAVTRNGRRLAAFGGYADAVGGYDLTKDLTGDPPPRIFDAASGLGERISAFNGDGTRLLLSVEGGGPLDLYSGTTGAAIKSDILAGDSAADPEWSPDNGTIAYTDSEQSLRVVSAAAADQFGTPILIHEGASSPGGSVDWHPTWSPDSHWLAYQHGAVMKFGSGRSDGLASLWLISPDGRGNV